MNYYNLQDNLDLQLSIVQVDIEQLCDKSNFPLKEDVRKKLTALYIREEKLNNLFNKVLDKIRKEEETDYIESEDGYIPSIHNDQFSFNN